MDEQLWLEDVSEQLSCLLEEAFAGVQFDVVPLVARHVATLDVSWTDGPSLQEVDLLALEFVLRSELDVWGTSSRLRIDRISKRRSMSPAIEEELLRILRADWGINVAELDMEQFYPLPSILRRMRSCPGRGTVPEFLDLLFEATGFSGAPAIIAGR